MVKHLHLFYRNSKICLSIYICFTVIQRYGKAFYRNSKGTAIFICFTLLWSYKEIDICRYDEAFYTFYGYQSLTSTKEDVEKENLIYDRNYVYEGIFCNVREKNIQNDVSFEYEL